MRAGEDRVRSGAPVGASTAATRDRPPDPDVSGWTRAAPDADALRNDVLLAVGLFVASILSFTLWQVAGMYEDPAPAWLSVLCLAGVTLPLALRRRRPCLVLVVVGATFIVLGSTRVPETLVANIALFLALYTVGAWAGDRRRAGVVRGAVIVAMFVWLLVALFHSTTDPDALPDLSRAGVFSPLVAFLLIQLLTNVAYFAAAYWFGENAWNAARARARVEARTCELEAERRVVASQAVALERLRLARELHDAVAHHVSLMGVQASAARTLLPAEASAASQALEHVEEAARQAIDELQGILGTLRDAGAGEGHDAVGSLDVERLPQLVEETAATGLPVSFQVVGEPRPLPPLVSLNLYRIAQEALTNTRKHAGRGATADVRLRYVPAGVEIEITDDGVGARRGTSTGSGLGLVGMRERVAADGGTLEAGPRPRGGFLVRAHVPLAASPALPASAPAAPPAPLPEEQLA
ncbi:histidine kinase [Actinotalea ferrariae CF5-4]|uniref:histidine kinase n=1 Tax=Actinotalea ferrariae CF5-4 TaxID=948458 RepID=A0A021VRT8_9CELL|nr:sensor histidine kinase [Actinotalea ferrariae]EYR62775.1 histidine kinase [Actinotalea ferrariae CF5-4]